MSIVRANEICPGSATGPRIERFIAARAKRMTPDAVRQRYAAGTALRRLPDPESVVALALFVASPAAAMISGQALAVDDSTINPDP